MPDSTLSSDTLLCQFTAAVTHADVATAISALLARLLSPLRATGIWTNVVAKIVRTGFGTVAIEVADMAMQHFPLTAELRNWHANALHLCAQHEVVEQRAAIHLSAFPTTPNDFLRPSHER